MFSDYVSECMTMRYQYLSLSREFKIQVHVTRTAKGTDDVILLDVFSKLSMSSYKYTA